MNVMGHNRHFEKEAMGLFASPKRSRLYDVNIERLKTVIEHLTHLKDIEKLTDKDFSTLITRACARFVEDEMSLVINNVLGKSVRDLKDIFEGSRDEWR